MDNPLLSIEEVAEWLQVTVKSLSDMIGEGRFPRGRRIDSYERWSHEDLAAYLLLAERWGPIPDDSPK